MLEKGWPLKYSLPISQLASFHFHAPAIVPLPGTPAGILAL